MCIRDRLMMLLMPQLMLPGGIPPAPASPPLLMMLLMLQQIFLGASCVLVLRSSVCRRTSCHSAFQVRLRNVVFRRCLGLR
eukprot:9293862-Pyramimonas_sp.AAC.1